VKLSVDYPKLSVYNMRMIQGLLDRIESLEKKISRIIYSLNVLGFRRSSRAQTVPPCLRPLIQSGDGFCFGSGTIGSFTVSSVSIFLSSATLAFA